MMTSWFCPGSLVSICSVIIVEIQINIKNSKWHLRNPGQGWVRKNVYSVLKAYLNFSNKICPPGFLPSKIKQLNEKDMPI